MQPAAMRAFSHDKGNVPTEAVEILDRQQIDRVKLVCSFEDAAMTSGREKEVTAEEVRISCTMIVPLSQPVSSEVSLSQHKPCTVSVCGERIL